MTHSVPVRLHWVHSTSPLGTTHRILLSRHEAQATDALCLTCCLLDCLEEVWFRDETFSWLDASVEVSGRDLVSDLVEDMVEADEGLLLGSGLVHPTANVGNGLGDVRVGKEAGFNNINKSLLVFSWDEKGSLDLDGLGSRRQAMFLMENLVNMVMTKVKLAMKNEKRPSCEPNLGAKTVG